MSEERRRERQMMVFRAGMLIREKLGAVDTRDAVDEVRIAALCAVAETRALFAALIDKRVITPAEYEDYLDKGYQLLLAQIEGKAQEIFVAGARGRG